MRKDEFPIIEKHVQNEINAVLDKIRAEIIKHFEGCYLEEDMTDERKAEHKAYENVLQIIDKYTK